MRGEGPQYLVKAIGGALDIDKCHRESEYALECLFRGRRNPDNSLIQKTTPVHKDIQSYDKQFDASMKIANHLMAREKVPENLWLDYDRLAGQSSSPRVKARSRGGGIIKCTFGSRPGITQWPESDFLVAQMMHPTQSPKRSDRSGWTYECHDTQNKSDLKLGRWKGCSRKEVLSACVNGVPDNNGDDVQQNGEYLHLDQAFRGSSSVKCSNNSIMKTVGGRARTQVLSSNNVRITRRKETQKHDKRDAFTRAIVTDPSLREGFERDSY